MLVKRSSRRGLLFGLAVMLVAALLLAACGGGDGQTSGGGDTQQGAGGDQTGGGDPGAGETKVLKLGAALSLTGALTREGTLTQQGYELWREKVNSEGGLKVGDDRYQVEIIYYDDKTDGTTAAKLVEKLITEDGVQFVFGPWGSGISQATSAITEKYGVVTLLPVANADAVYERGFKYMFGIIPAASRGMAAHVEMIDALDDTKKTVAIITPDDLFPVAGAEGAIAAIEKSNNLELVLYEKYPNESTDLQSVMTRVKEANPDILLSPAYYEHNALTVRAAKDLNLNLKFIGLQGTVDIPEWTENFGEDGEYVTGYTWWAPQVQFQGPVFGSAAEFTRAFEEKYGLTPEFSAAAAATAGIVFQMAVERAGTLDVDAVRDAIAATDMQTFFGNIRYDERGENTAGEAVLIQIQDDERIVVWPEDGRQKELIYPMPAWNER